MQTQFKKISILILAIVLVIGCKKDSEFLTEVRKDGLTTDNALITKSQFDLALNTCYRQLQYFYNSADGWTDYWHLGVNFDVVFAFAVTTFKEWVHVSDAHQHGWKWWCGW